MIESNVRVEKDLIAHRSSSLIHREGVKVEPPNKNRSLVKRQDVKKKGTFKEHLSRLEKFYIVVNTTYTKIYTALRGQNLL